MVKPELGTKRSCPNCSTRFYDLQKDPIVCPKCGYAFVAEALLPSKMEHVAAAAPVAKAVVVPDDEEFDEVELVSLDDIEGEDKDDDEVPAIEDVEIVDDDVVKDEDAFLEDDDEEGADVTGIIGVNDDDEET
ncbi:TIGR02300 family protein [Rhodoligotrophos defluvii]|uniref:TIGR02300 family protein n=1 Tax=Rhodoligotrophos defluvii TaxID=2561934 RepID=UPI0010C9AC69|nr:TIGR02300 family protein [Rhodoligotrophos defluvii]